MRSIRQRRQNQEQTLVAYTTPAMQDTAELQSALAARLPSCMVPSVIVALEVFPLARNGKVDRVFTSRVHCGAGYGATRGIFTHFGHRDIVCVACAECTSPRSVRSASPTRRPCNVRTSSRSLRSSSCTAAMSSCCAPSSTFESELASSAGLTPPFWPQFDGWCTPAYVPHVKTHVCRHRFCVYTVVGLKVHGRAVRMCHDMYGMP